MTTMKKIDAAQTVNIVANIGVIAGIIFLGFEVSQNNSLLESQARQNRANGARELNSAIYSEETGLARAIEKARAGEQLTTEEELRLDRYLTAVILDWEFWYEDFSDDILNEEDLRAGGWRRLFHEVLPQMAGVWEQARLNSNPEFVAFMEENIVNP